MSRASFLSLYVFFTFKKNPLEAGFFSSQHFTTLKKPSCNTHSEFRKKKDTDS